MVLTSDPKCPACGRSRSEWRTNNSEGVQANGKTFCCEACSTGGACTCTLLQEVPTLEENINSSSGPDGKTKTHTA